MAGGGSGSGSQTVTQTQQIPAWQQGYAQENENIAAGLASRPYQNYQGQMIAGFTPLQQQGMDMTTQAANSYQPDLQAAEGMTAGAATPWNTQTAQQYMSPYAMAALAPQMQQLGLQQAQQQRSLDAGATQAGAFGDARHGVAQGLNNFYGNLAMNDLVSQGMNSAYNSGLGAFQNDQSRMLQAGGQMAGLGAQQQQLGLGAGSAVFGAGTQQQELQQEQLNNAYQNFMQQQNYPIQMLNLRMASLANSPYNTTQLMINPPSNSTAMNLGGFGALAGGLGQLFGQGSGAQNIFGGQH